MFYLSTSLPQSSFGLSGLWGISGHSFTSLNSYEFNPSNYSVIKDWAFSFSYGSELSNRISSNLYQFSAGKSFNDHFISLRYSPGFQKEFVFQSEVVTSSNSESSVLESRYHYKELLGFGYSNKTSKYLSVGLNVRLFEQDFTNETVSAVFSDSVYFIRESEEDKSNFWKADAGIVWQPANNLFFGLSTLNLFILNNKTNNPENDGFKLKTDRSFLLGAGYSPVNDLNLNFIYESTSSFQGGFSTSLNIDVNKIGIGVTSFHDKEQVPFLAGVTASAIYSSGSFDISLSWIKYFSDRKSAVGVNNFSTNGISNILNNRYSNDKIILTANFKLSAGFEQRVKFLDVNINTNIYPTLAEKYIHFPFATATVENLTGEKIEVKPAAMINMINNENIYSPQVYILPYDTIEISFYTIIPDDFSILNPEISFVNFFLQTVHEDYDDKFQKAILINGKNAWDGSVHNLKYFIEKDRGFTINYSKQVLSKHKSELDSLRSDLLFFYKAKFIFNDFIKDMLYISDPRASAEYVQYPKETIELKGGDCDDLSVCYSALLESVGIETALVDFKSEEDLRHVNIMFNTKLSPGQANLITENDMKYFVRKEENGNDEVWIPVETTALTGFNNAWNIAAEKFQKEVFNKLGLLKGDVEIIDVY